MGELPAIFKNEIIIVSVFSWFVAQMLKVIGVLIKEKKIDFSRFIGLGGMPSSHTAFVVSLATSMGKNVGFDSPSFAITFALAMIVMVDSSGVRRAAGYQAKILNIIIEHWKDRDPRFVGEKLIELLGHTRLEVIAGALLGIIIAIIL